MKKCLNYTYKKQFSIIHNYHSPYTLWYHGKFVNLDDKMEEYNKYIQAFLSKRFTHKREIPPKIKILPKDLNNTLKDYHNSFYIQKTYPLYTLLDLSYLKQMHNLNIIDSGYILSRFCEDGEKNMIDAIYEKVLVCGRVEFLEDYEFFENIRKECKRLVDVFYNGDKLSPFEREIERAYLHLKREKMGEIARISEEWRRSKRECFLTFSERNKIHGHVNFRMRHPTYFFNARPVFEKINPEVMFNSLYEIRNNSLSFLNNPIKKLKLKFQYRKSLMRGYHRVEFVAYYIYLQIFQYLESYEFNNEFKLNLNFRVTFNMLLLHLWLIVQRLQKIQIVDMENNKFCEEIIEMLKERIINHFRNNLDKFQFSQHEVPQIPQISKFIDKVFDFYTWHFNVIARDNVLANMKNLFAQSIFLSKLDVGEKELEKFCYYVYIHYEYLERKSYKEIEQSDFCFSCDKIPINFGLFIKNADDLSFEKYATYEDIYTHGKDEYERILENYKKCEKSIFFQKLQKNSKNSNDDAENLISTYGHNPWTDHRNFILVDRSKSILRKLDNLVKPEMGIQEQIELENVKYENELANKKISEYSTIWDEVNKEEEMLGLSYVSKIKEKRELFRKNNNMVDEKK